MLSQIFFFRLASNGCNMWEMKLTEGLHMLWMPGMLRPGQCLAIAEAMEHVSVNKVCAPYFGLHDSRAAAQATTLMYVFFQGQQGR